MSKDKKYTTIVKNGNVYIKRVKPYKPIQIGKIITIITIIIIIKAYFLIS